MEPQAWQKTVDPHERSSVLNQNNYFELKLTSHRYVIGSPSQRSESFATAGLQK